MDEARKVPGEALVDTRTARITAEEALAMHAEGRQGKPAGRGKRGLRRAGAPYGASQTGGPGPKTKAKAAKKAHKSTAAKKGRR